MKTTENNGNARTGMPRRAFLFDFPSFWIWLLLLAGIGLRWWYAGNFEFKLDQLQAVLAAENYRNPLTIAHGMRSSTGTLNPPGFYQWMAVWGWIGHGPAFFAAVFAAISAGAVALAWCMKRFAGMEGCRMVALVTATSPMLIFLSSNIWAQCLMVPFSFLIFSLLVRFREEGSDWDWGGAVMLTLAAGSIHLSALFLLPPLALLAWRRKIRGRVWGAIGGTGMALFGYYTYFLLTASGEGVVNVPDGNIWRAWLVALAEFVGGGFGFHVFEEDYPAVLGTMLTPWGAWLVLALGWGVTLTGWMAAAVRRKPYPESVRVALICCGWLAVVFPLLGIKDFYYYGLIVWAPAAWLLVEGWRRWLKPEWGRVALIVFSGAMLVNGWALKEFVAGRGGHVRDYGVDCRVWREVEARLRDAGAAEKCNLVIRVRDREAAKKLEAPVLQYLLGDFFQPGKPEVFLDISSEKGEYRFSLTDGGQGAK